MEILGLGKSIGTGVTLLRAFRILRIVRILQRFKTVRVILGAVTNILPSISNVMALFGLILFIYACVGISLFAQVKPNDSINEYNTFQTFPGAMVILMRFSTGEDWNVYMEEFANQEDCMVSQSYESMQSDGIQGCGTQLAFGFFISF